MSTTPVIWRPASERDLDALRALVDTALADWQSRWFGAKHFTVGEVVHLPPGAFGSDMRAETGHRCAPGIRLDMLARSDRALIKAAFATTDAVFDSPACHDRLVSIAEEIRDDLSDTLRSALTPSGMPDTDVATAKSAGRYGAVRLTIESLRGDALTSLVCDVTYIWERNAGRPAVTSHRHVADTTTPRRVALDLSPITLAVLLGRCQMSAAQLTALSPGDVLVLDHRIDDPVMLLADGTSSPVAFGTPGRTGAALSFKLTSLATPDSP
ncbi:hypothetical protein DF107_31545 [Burkholderia stagnalis]|uniref:FliM/FliN family flagellar motor C-terminal domain-containing protein n=1 Tax=Burkholderia stagnalis TaxID=1503054 RepID=UPI000F5A1CE9|nr:FliM/FliN family flagellar motor C-terminal domain-containing protein [Burkholderia stagnalis]RQQ07084.1 hypothetical protein DF161_31130 [Burkholderia stagnalis]RQQ94125.1 hypothetical protein DF031_29920 [Burkholderia stagnalis]RQX85860.1 hypothetical protein DF120_31910 [Burkholderia stagnalis]RQY14945.1 hypothetical protein DF117_27910 [Burkholderia stagnalis]RQY75907.1 hypothetical protein DF107_31545 [Burkholderia stagnalis]